MATHERLLAYIDGASRGNPGPASLGVALYSPEGALVQEIAKPLGSRTNNQAEYLALLEALEAARRLGASHLVVRSDSQLIVRQMTGEYTVKDQALQLLHAEARRASRGFATFEITHVPREKNKVADKLANRALDAATDRDHPPAKARAGGGRSTARPGTAMADGDTLVFRLPNRQALQPLLVEIVKLLKRRLGLPSREVEEILDRIEAARLWPDAPVVEDFALKVVRENGEIRAGLVTVPRREG